MSLSLSLGTMLRSGGTGFAPTTTLTPAMWTLRQASVGQRGISTGGVGAGEQTLTAVGDTGRPLVTISPVAAEGGEWGVYLGNAEGDMAVEALGAVTSRSGIVALGTFRRYLGLGSRPWAQVFYRATPGSGSWLVASAPKLIDPPLTGRSTTLTLDDFTVEPFVIDPATVGLRVPRRGDLALARRLWTTTATVNTDPRTYPSVWTEALLSAPADETGEPVEGAGHFYLDTLDGAPDTSLANLKIVYQNTGEKVSGESPAQTVVRPGVPASMGAGSAQLVDGLRPGQDVLILRILSLPASGLPLTGLDIETSANGSTWGDGFVVPPQAQEIEITTTGAGVAGYARVRARNELGPAGAWFALGPVTPTTGTADLTITATPGSGVVVGQAVHFKVAATTINALALANGVSADDFEAEAEWRWQFSVGNGAEDYPFTALPSDHMGAKTAGVALGRFAVHAYVTEGNHTARCQLYWRGTLVATGDRTIAATPRSYAVGSTGYWNPDGATAGADGIPSGANVFSDLNTAWAWVGAADGRALYLRRGKSGTLSISGTPLRANATIAAYDATGPHGTTGARPLINVDLGWESIARIAATGDGTEQTYTGLSLGASIYVYFDNVLQTEGVGYTRGVNEDANKITATVPNGQRLRVYNQASNGRLLFGGTALSMGTGRNGGIVRDINAEGNYIPSQCGSFDNTDLYTANRFAPVSFINGGSGTHSFITVLNCNINGFHGNIGTSLDGEMVGAINCNLDRWANYGFYTNCARAFTVGCSIVQDRLTLNGGQGKGFNRPIQTSGSAYNSLNAPWHGPIRCAYSFEQVLNACRIDSRNSWAGDNDLSAQPCTRLAASTRVNQSYSYTQCHTSGGWGCFSGGAPNETVAASRYGMAYVGYNVFNFYPGKESFGNGQIYVTSISNLYHIPAGTGDTASFAFFRKQTTSPYIATDDVRQEPWRSINDTFLVLDSRASTLDINPSYVLSSPGIQNLWSVTALFASPSSRGTRGGYPVPPAEVGTATVRVPLSPDNLAAKDTFATRIWRGSPEPSATSAATVTAQRALYDWQYAGMVLNDDGFPPNGVQYIDVTLKSGVWQAGDVVWISREQCAETAGSTEIDEETGEQIGVPPGAPETFLTNNRTVALTRPPAALHNSLILMPTPWSTVKLADAVVSDTSGYLPSAFGTWDAYWRPVTGNTAIDAATGVKAAFDVRGQLRVGSTARGALEPDTDVTGWPAIPLVPSVSVVLSPATYTEGDAFGADNVVATIASAGAPTLTAGDIAKTAEVISNETGLVTSTTGDASVDAGTSVRGRIVWAHPTVPRQDAETAKASVIDPNFSPIWINSNAALVSPWNGGRVNRTGMTSPVAGRNHHIAFRIRNRAGAVNGAARLYDGPGVSTATFQLRLGNASNLFATANGTTISGSTVTIPNTSSVASVLVSSYLAGDGPGGAFMRMQIKIDDGSVQTLTFGASALALFNTQFRIFSATQGTPDVDFSQFFGLWTGGVPDWSDFFEADGEVRDWASNPTLDVAGMAQHCLLNGIGTTGSGIDTFNGRLDTGALEWVRRLAPTTNASSVTFDGVTFTFDKPMPVGTFVDGTPFVVSNAAFNITAISTPSTGTGADARHGAMLGSTMAGEVNGFDGIATGYNAALNVDPGATAAPISFDAGDADAVVKAISVTGTRDNAWTNISKYSVLTVVAATPFLGAFRPAIAGVTRAPQWTEDDIDWGVLSSLAMPIALPSAAVTLGKIPLVTMTWHTNSASARDFRTEWAYGAASTNYAREYGETRLEAMFRLHSDISRPDKRALAIRMIQMGIDFAGVREAGLNWITDGGLTAGVMPAMYLAAIALDDATLLAAAQSTISNDMQQAFWVASDDVGRAVNYPDTSGGGDQYHQTYQAAMLGVPEWGVRANTAPERHNSSLSARYRYVSSPAMALNPLAVGLLDGGEVAWINGASNTTNDRYATIGWMDRYVRMEAWRLADFPARDFVLTSGTNTLNPVLLDVYESHRASLASPIWEGVPDIPPPPTITAQSGALGYTLSLYDQPQGGTLVRRDLSYSIDPSTGPAGKSDPRQWIVVEGVGASGTLSGLTDGLKHHVRSRIVSSLGAGPWSAVGPRESDPSDTPDQGAGTPNGTPSNAAPVNTVLPKIFRKIGTHTGPSEYVEVTGELPEGVSVLYAGVGYWTGYPALTFTYQWKRNGVNISGATSDSYAWSGSGDITVTVTATNSQGAASATSAAVELPASATTAWYSPSGTDGATVPNPPWIKRWDSTSTANLTYSAASSALSLAADAVNVNTHNRFWSLSEVGALTDLSGFTVGDIYLKWRFQGTNNNSAGCGIWVRASGTDTASSDGYIAESIARAGGNWGTIRFRSMTAGTASTLVTDNLAMPTANASGADRQISLRLNVSLSGSDLVLRARHWHHLLTAEPSVWHIEHTISSPKAAGRIGLSIPASRDGALIFGLGVSIDPATPAPTGP